MKHGLLGLLVLTLAAGTGYGYQDSYEYPAIISTTATGTASGEPDIASIVFGVDIARSEPAIAVDDAAKMIRDAMAAARAAGVAGEDMQTVSYNLWVQEVWDDYTYEYTGVNEYNVIHYIRADIRDIESVGDVLAAVVSAGANSVNGVSFYVEDTDALFEQARRIAVDNARNKAEQLVDCFGVSLGEISSISEWTNYYYQDYYGAYDCYTCGSGYCESPSITPGAFSISVEVSASWELEH